MFSTINTNNQRVQEPFGYSLIMTSECEFHEKDNRQSRKVIFMKKSRYRVYTQLFSSKPEVLVELIKPIFKSLGTFDVLN